MTIDQDGPSPVILALAKWVAGEVVSNEALYRMQQFGFIYPDSKGKLKLTPPGRQTLEENGLAQAIINENSVIAQQIQKSKIMSLEFLRTPFEKANYLASALSSHASGGSADDNEYRALRQELLSMPDIEKFVPSFVRINRDLTSFWHFIQPKFKTYAERRTFISEEFTPLLDFLEFGQRNGDVSPKPPAMPQTPVSLGEGSAIASVSIARNKRKVFIVHGRDNEAKQEVARFLSGLGLEPIILHEQASEGMTIIEKIERYANDADFALVLYTPCDHGRGVHETKVPARNRARQNVVFEHGYLMAKLGRENVCALVKGEIETPNDISGVVYVSLDGYGGWKIEVTKELQACGYEVKSIV